MSDSNPGCGLRSGNAVSSSKKITYMALQHTRTSTRVPEGRKKLQNSSWQVRCRIVGFFLFLAISTAAQPISPGLFSGLKWRLIGPFRGGRVVAVAGVPGDSTSYYF